MADQAKYLDVTIVTPFGEKVEYTVKHLRASGIDGEFGILPEHIPFLTMLQVGSIRLTTENGDIVYATSGGFLEVLNDKITILAETAERADCIDVTRAEDAKRRALDNIRNHNGIDSTENATIALKRAINRLKVASGS